MENEFIKEISEMNLEQITERKAELETEIRSAESKESLEGMEEKINAINTRIAELKEFETRKAHAEALQNNVVVPDKTIEETRKEEGKMVDYRTAFLKTMLGKELDVEERAAYSTLTNAGAAVPEELQADIISKAKEYAPILNEITLLNVQGGVKFAVEGTTDAAGTHTELATITAASDSIVEVVLSAYEITKLIQISATVKNMSLAQFESWLTSTLAESIAMKLENLVFNGSGVGEATGILTVKSSGDLTTITTENIFALVGKLKSGYARNAKWAINRKTFFTTVLPLQDKSKNDLVVFDNGKYRLLGAEVLWTDSVADGDVIFGDFKKYVANLASPQQVVSQFDINTNSYKYLGAAEFDGKVALAEAFVTIQGA